MRFFDVYTSIIFGIAIIISALLGGVLVHWYDHESILKEDDIAIREYDQRYPYIRPLLICQINEQEESREYRLLENVIESVVMNAKTEGLVKDMSVYFRDLNTGRWTGVNEEVEYSPASLLKVPILLSYFKKAETAPEILNTQYQYIKHPDDVNPLVSKRLLQSGNIYSVKSLIRGMIVDSDNSAKDVLIEHADREVMRETYSALGINDPYQPDITQGANPQYKISTKKYALFFRAIYNGTFLNREMSNDAAVLLSEVNFDKGLRAGTPTNIRIAHKYGISAPVSTEGATIIVELSDCGIVYNGQSPYLLCVMTRGTNPYILGEVIKKVAETTYRTVTTQK